MNVDEDSLVVAKPRRRWLKRIGCGLVVLLALALILSIPAISTAIRRHHAVGQRLDEALADLDRSDPGWRLSDIEAARAQIPEEENSARVVAKAGSLLPNDWKSELIEDLLKNLSPEEHLAPDILARLVEELDAVRPALEEARKLAGLGRGRHRINYERNIIGTLLKDQSKVLPLTELLRGDALRHEQKGDLAAAMVSCRAAFNAGRSIGDEPFAVSQLIRVRSTYLACQGVERVLAQGQPPVEEMAAFQRMLEEEDAFPDLLISARGERAADQEMFDAFESGDISFSTMSEQRPNWNERLFGFVYRDNVREEHPMMLALMSRWTALVKLPSSEQRAAELQLERMFRNLPESAIFTRLMLPIISKVGTVSRRNHGYLRCLNAALAAERYRRDKQDWPDTIDQLCPKYLSAVPPDPFDELPLRYRQVEDGVIIYAVGQDAVDNGGRLNREHPDEPGVDVGVRLWDAAKRRHTPHPE